MSAAGERRPRVLVICADQLGSSLAGVAVRAYELSRVLMEHADVTLAGVEAETPPPPGVPAVTYALRDPRALRPHIERADAIFAQQQWPVIARWMRRSRARLVYDLVTPEPFELIEGLAGQRLTRRVLVTLALDRLLAALHDGHHFVCGGQKQRDLWIGALMAGRVITPELYDSDPSLLSVIDPVPFGTSPEPPRAAGRGPEDRFGAIGPGDEVALWSGGIWGWLDAPSAIRAVAEVVQRRPRLKLVFMAASSATQAQAPEREAKRVAEELGLLDRVVFFNDSWVPYEERADWLLRASCALSAHQEHLETRFAFRTRVLDCFWARLPIVASGGDELAGRIEREDLGATAPPGDVPALAAALERVLERGRDAFEPQLAAAAAEHEWTRVAQPLVRYVTDPGPPPPRPRVPRRPLHRARDEGFRAALAGLNALGIERTPFL
ncbi:MAG TPA: glycosyltransferase [Thermoleophilaceae bacterium]